jgi:hypothetical protein
MNLKYIIFSVFLAVGLIIVGTRGTMIARGEASAYEASYHSCIVTLEQFSRRSHR